MAMVITGARRRMMEILVRGCMRSPVWYLAACSAVTAFPAASTVPLLALLLLLMLLFVLLALMLAIVVVLSCHFCL